MSLSTTRPAIMLALVNGQAWRRWVDGLLDRLYPPSCVLCGVATSSGRCVCADCAEKLPRLRAPYCRVCGQAYEAEMQGHFRCANCSGLRLAFEFARPALQRDEQALELIHRLKYGRAIHLARDLGRLMAEAFEDPRLAEARNGCWPLVPVPLHRSRLRWRHFNQSFELARVLSIELGLPMLEAVKRVRKTSTQTVLSRKRRLKNMQQAFALTRRGRQWLLGNPSGVVLVDDVLTTGSTAHACAQVLRRAGVPRVVVVTAMRG